VLWCKSSDGTKKSQTCSDEVPLTLERSKTVDEEISTKVVEFLDRNDPKKTGKPFFVWYNPARMHVVRVLSPKYEAMLGERQGLGRQRSRHEADDDNIGHVLKKLESMGRKSTIPAGQYPGIVKTTLDAKFCRVSWRCEPSTAVRQRVTCDCRDRRAGCHLSVFRVSPDVGVAARRLVSRCCASSADLNNNLPGDPHNATCIVRRIGGIASDARRGKRSRTNGRNNDTRGHSYRTK
jgi:hypothetical protein